MILGVGIWIDPVLVGMERERERQRERERERRRGRRMVNEWKF